MLVLKTSIYYFFYTATCKALHARSLNCGCNARFLQTLSTAVCSGEDSAELTSPGWLFAGLWFSRCPPSWLWELAMTCCCFTASSPLHMCKITLCFPTGPAASWEM